MTCDVIDDPSEAEGATMDCANPDCNSLLIYKDGEVRDFHKWMYQKSKEDNEEFIWPEDGRGTGYFQI